ncbi:UNVERIFIED_CONTAM: hypothetical protein HDU68_007928 [Siphonaria sp. JEL0065]|nr:hypothetical protein HDU68_007928 [Siphonaria sp. JEL0065]
MKPPVCSGSGSAHSVKFVVAAQFQLAARVVAVVEKSKKKTTAQKLKEKEKEKVPFSNAEAEKRSFQFQYSIGSQVSDAKSHPFVQQDVVAGSSAVVPPTAWQQSHDIDVSSDVAIALLTQHQRIEIQVYEIVKIEVEKKSGLTREMLEGMGINKDILNATVADYGITAKQQKHRIKVLKELLASTHTNKTNAINQSTSMSSKDLTGSSIENTSGSLSASRPLSRATTASGATTADSEDETVDHNRDHHQRHPALDGPHPHHYDHPEKHMRRASTTSMLRTRSAQSLANLNLLRPKTPPSPHHCESPLATLKRRPGSNGPIHMPPPPDLTSMRPKKVPARGRMLRSGSADTINFLQPAPGLFDKNGATGASLPQLSTPKIEHDATSLISSNPNSNSNTTGGTSTSSKKKKEKAAAVAKKRYIFETRRILVGKMKIDLTNLYCGELVINGILEQPIECFSNLKSTLTLDMPLLSPAQLRALNPISITLLTLENMPKTPVSYVDLDNNCLPTTATFQFYNDKHVHEVCVNSKHTRVSYFGTRHVILAGLLDQRDLQARVLGEEFSIRVYDRIPKRKRKVVGDGEGPGVGEFEDDPLVYDLGPYGIASFNLREFFQRGSGITRVRAPVLPSHERIRRPEGYKNSSAPPAAHWMEHATNLVIECQTFSPLLQNAALIQGMDSLSDEDENVFGRVVIFSKNQNHALRDAIDRTISSLNSQSSLLLGSSVQDPQTKRLNYISGYILTDPIHRIHILEGLRQEGIFQLKLALATLDKESNETTATGDKGPQFHSVFQFDPNAGFPDRVWDSSGTDGEGRVVRCEFSRSLMEDVVKVPQIYVKDFIPERAYDSLMWLNKIKSMHFLIENTGSKMPYYPSRRTLHSLVTTFGIISPPTPKPTSPVTSLTSTVSTANNNNALTNTTASSTPGTKPSSSTLHKYNSKLPPVVSEYSTSKLHLKKPTPTHPHDVIPHHTDRPHSPPPIAKPRERAPYTANPSECVFNYSMQKASSTSMQLRKIRAGMKKDVCYMYSKSFKLDLGKVEI